uniref:Uncharacterized protein n=1 Tax=Triticum aestivum TaxID=4565 RepID=A0A3B6N0S6_WHEAT
MVGLILHSTCKHATARLPIFRAPLSEYWPPSFLSMTRKNPRLLVRYGRTHSTRLRSAWGRFVSSARRPHIISRSTTPKPYTSHFAVR